MKFNYPIQFRYKSSIFLILFSALVIFSIFDLKSRIIPLKGSVIILDKNDIEIGEIPVDNKIRHREIFFSEIPDFYKKIAINWEDRSFYYNVGISPTGLLRSLLNNISGGSTQGASTISSQFIRNNLWLNEKRGFLIKIQEFYYSILLNVIFSKEAIFEKYANQVYFGYMNYGLKSASIYYFDKEPNNLTKAEVISLFSIQKNSNRYDPYLKKANFRSRFEYMTKSLNKSGIISNEELTEILNEKLEFNTEHSNKMPYICDFINTSYSKKIKGILDGNIIRTTVDYSENKAIEAIGNASINDLAWKKVGDYGVLIVNRKTHNLEVMIGGKNYYSPEGQVNSTLSLRQPGSTIKPFTYLLASKNLGQKPNDTILDLPVSYKTKEGYSYEPKNYSTRFEGEVSVGEALAQSMNVPAVKTLEKLGVGNLLVFLRKLGITSLQNNEDFYGLALTLGDGEVTLFELLRAYTIFPDSGNLCDINLFKKTKSECKLIIEKKYTDEINQILSSRYLKIGGYPINSALDFSDIEVFFKTGTSRNFRDNWTLGYTKDYLIGVWAGNKDASNMKGVSGATGAGEIFGKIVRYLEPTTGRIDKFETKNTNPNYLEITSPLPGSVFKLDKYIPVLSQKIGLRFSTGFKYDTKKWLIDGKEIKGDLLEPFIGNHDLVLELYKDNIKISSAEVSFEVRNSD